MYVRQACGAASLSPTLEKNWMHVYIQKCKRNSECRFCIMGCPDSWWIIMYQSTPTIGQLKSVGSHGNLSPLFPMNVMVWYFVTTLIRLWPALIVVVKISLQFRRYVQQESNSRDVVVDNLQGAYTLRVCHITPIPGSEAPRQWWCAFQVLLLNLPSPQKFILLPSSCPESREWIQDAWGVQIPRSSTALREKGARQESLKLPDSSISGILCSSSGDKSMLEQGKALGPVSEAIMSLSPLLKLDHFSEAYVGSS